MRKAKKTFDAVATMNAIRDRLSAQIEGMSFEEETDFIRKHVPQPKTLGSRQPPDETILPPRLRSATRASSVPSARKKRSPRRG
jgi:hypothetical protein